MKGNQKKCHSKLDLESHHKLLRNDEILNQVQDDEGRSGFTLIELLVVVLIIGILSAIAVPQYQKAVLKSRFSSLMPTTQAIRDGNEMYYMTNGGYANDVAKLDVTAANTDDMTITLSDDDDYAYTMATRPNINNNLIMYQKHSANFPGEIHCEALKGNSQAEWLCGTALHAVKELGEVITPKYNTYVLEGIGNGMTLTEKELLEFADLTGVDCATIETQGFTCSLDPQKGSKTVCKEGVCVITNYDETGKRTSKTICKLDANEICFSKKEERYNKKGQLEASFVCKKTDTSTGECTEYNNMHFYRYDDQGHMISDRECKTLGESGSCESYTTTSRFLKEYVYDDNGYLVAQLGCRSVNDQGNCSYYTTGETGKFYQYDNKGNILSDLYCSEVNSSTGKCTQYRAAYGSDRSTYYTYDDNGNTLTERVCSTINSTTGKCTSYSTSKSFDYKYEDQGNTTTQLNCGGFNSEGKCTSYRAGGYNDGDDDDYWYVNYGTKETSYDPETRTEYIKTCAQINADGKCTSYQSDIRTGYYGAPTVIKKYDENGNLLSKFTCYEYNYSSNRCSSTSNSLSSYYEYTYNPDGSIATQRGCNSGAVKTTGGCTVYSGGGASKDYMYDDNGEAMQTKNCRSSLDSTQCEE